MRPHGVNRYKTDGCRCDQCRSAVAALERARRAKVQDGRINRTPILCGNCGRELEHCHGEHGDWMHTTTRRERCADGELASPETVEEFDARMRAHRHPTRSTR